MATVYCTTLSGILVTDVRAVTNRAAVGRVEKTTDDGPRLGMWVELWVHPEAEGWDWTYSYTDPEVAMAALLDRIKRMGGDC